MTLSLSSCGNNKDTTTSNANKSSTPQSTTSSVKEESKAQTSDASKQEKPIEETKSSEVKVEAPEETTPKIEVAKLAIGESLSTEFVEIKFEEVVVAENIKHSIKTGNVKVTTDPEPISGQQYVCITGKIKNLSKAPLPVYDFFVGEIDVDGYIYPINSTNCDTLDAVGNPLSKVDPLMEGSFRIYTAIPDSLAKSYKKATLRFGFYDLFDNIELSKNRAFEKDPTSLCPYQYLVTLK